MLIGLSALSFSFRCGLIGRGTDRLVSAPLDVDALMNLATRAGLQSIEFPLAMLPDLTPARLAPLRERLALYGLIPVIDSDIADVELLRAHIPATARLGAHVLRVLVSPVLEGARHALPGGWAAQMERTIAALRAVRSLAEEHGVTLAVENHQDATSADLIAICEAVGGPNIAVTFDLTNALAVAQYPPDALQQLAPYICNIHLSDYLAYPTPFGYRMVRCALGEGDHNFRHIFELIASLPREVTCQIELVAHSARHIRMLTPEWWEGYGPTDIRTLLPALRLVVENIRSNAEDWRSPWERGAPEATVAFYEDQQFAASVSFLRAIGVLPRV
jgi:sugar phosphate isomerase/epimerase